MLSSATKAFAAAKNLYFKIKGSILGCSPVEPHPLEDSPENHPNPSTEEEVLMVTFSESPTYGVPS